MIVKRGTRDKLAKFFDVNKPLKITLQVDGSATYDFCCFGVDKDEKLSDERYMIFYNQLSSPRSEIVGSKISNGMNFAIDLSKLPQTIQKLVFTASIDGAGVMSEISSHKIFIGDKISAEFGGTDFQREKAVTSLEIYRKNDWRFNVVARGFNVGLEALVAFYGGETEENITDTIDTLERFGLDKATGNKILSETRNLEPARRQAFVNAINILSDSRPFVDAAQRMAAYDTLCEELSQLNTMRGGVKGFKGFVGEHLQAANETAIGRATRVVNDNGAIDLIFEG
ncbi:MAG: TerD family protein, partial [Selenomonadaceae bacterium]|nr:TerD family protein [Selenomonadaceae bacterium]